MFTPEQEKYLADLADQGLVTQKEAEARQAEIDKTHGPIDAAYAEALAAIDDQVKTLKEAGQEEQAQNLIDDTVTRVTTTIVPALREQIQSDEVASN